MTWAWIETSSADTGSSSITTRRSERERAGDADPLALAAGELVREAVEVLGVQPDALEQLARARLPLVARHAGDAQRRGEDLADPLARVERRLRILEDHLHLAPQRRHLAARGLA